MSSISGSSSRWRCWGSVLAANERYGAAAEHFERAVHRVPAFVEARYNLALALERSGRADESPPHLKAALELDPAHVRSNHLLGTLLARRE